MSSEGMFCLQIKGYYNTIRNTRRYKEVDVEYMNIVTIKN